MAGIAHVPWAQLSGGGQKLLGTNKKVLFTVS